MLFSVDNYEKKLPVILDITSTQNSTILFNNYFNSISKAKAKIDDKNINTKWDKIKKIGNPYELIHIIPSKDKRNYSIAAINPVSRSFFKLIEIINKFELLNNKTDIKISCLAEGPGGFIEAFLHRFKNNIDKIFAITLFNKNKYVPGWDKLITTEFDYNNIVTCIYGDLYNVDDIHNFVDKSNKADIITADGGLDYSKDFNNQEQLSYKIIYSEIVTCLSSLNKNGIFVIKFFDMYGLLSIQMLYIIYALFDKVHIYKPNTSRPANSEKYIIATGFYGIETKLLKSMILILKNWDKYNENFLNNQIFHLNHIMELIHNTPSKDIIQQINKNQTILAINWCIDNNIPVNGASKYIKNVLYNKSLNKIE